MFTNVRLVGGWDESGAAGAGWTTRAMTPVTGADGGTAYSVVQGFPEASIGARVRWTVLVDSAGRTDQCGVTVHDEDETPGTLSFVVPDQDGRQVYHLTHCRLLGANKRVDGAGGPPSIEFAVWAPHARRVDVVIGDPASGYVADDGTGTVAGPFPMVEHAGVWRTDPGTAAELADFSSFDHVPYMFRVERDDGSVRMRTDLHSRCQIGRGTTNPRGRAYTGTRAELDGTVSCSVVIDPERVTEEFDEGVWPETRWLSEAEFWSTEHNPLHRLPTRLEDLVIYELHVGGLGAGRTTAAGEPEPGSLQDAIAHLDHLVDLGVNAVELLPMAEFEGWASWGYGTSHYGAVEFSGGGRDQFKHFVRACHRRGIAVILDVVYNHFHHDAERAQWAYDSPEPERNLYYWYELDASRATGPDAGYVDNMSTGYAPRYDEEFVRQLFISSAAALVTEFHVDGFRVDQTTSIHSYGRIHGSGEVASRANAWGVRFLQQWTRTMRLLQPTVFLVAEDHSGWSGVTGDATLGGLGFDAVWYADFYHHLCGDTGRGPDYANLLTGAGHGDDRPLPMAYFAGALAHTGHRTVVYHESHDEAGNSVAHEVPSGRTLTIAANRAPLVGETRRYAEARTRFATGMTLLSAGTPMFFMGEEVGFTEDYRYDDFVLHREDFRVLRSTTGQQLFRFYRSVLRLRLGSRALRSRFVRVVHTDDHARALAFLRTDGDQDVLVVGSLANHPADAMVVPGVPDGAWHEIFNSDSSSYGGWNHGNAGAALHASQGRLTLAVPRAGFVVLERR